MDNTTTMLIIGVVCTLLGVLIGYVQGCKATKARNAKFWRK